LQSCLASTSRLSRKAHRAIATDRGVAPNHGWRHRFKTIGMEAGIAQRVLDAIQGQAPRTVADTYGDVTVKTMAAAMGKFPRVEIGGEVEPRDGDIKLCAVAE
jgi:hypothetical protein